MINPPCCAVFSFFGVLFLVTIGLLLQKQPLYIKGPLNPAAAAQGCYQGALMYAATLVLSLVIIGYRRAASSATPNSAVSATPAASSSPSKSQYGAVGEGDANSN